MEPPKSYQCRPFPVAGCWYPTLRPTAPPGHSKASIPSCGESVAHKCHWMAQIDPILMLCHTVRAVRAYKYQKGPQNRSRTMIISVSIGEHFVVFLG